MYTCVFNINQGLFERPCINITIYTCMHMQDNLKSMLNVRGVVLNLRKTDQQEVVWLSLWMRVHFREIG